MFTGIIETIGRIERIIPVENYRRIVIRPDDPFPDVTIGESIAVSGPCLTVTAFDTRSFTVEASQETLAVTTLAALSPGKRVNLERALRADSRLGGHFVSGHIDAAVRVKAVRNVGMSLQAEIELAERFAPLVVDKGSVALDGVSLTVLSVAAGRFVVNVIPETRKGTTWGDRKTGDIVNVEFDMIGKYLCRFLDAKENGPSLTLDTLRKLGY